MLRHMRAANEVRKSLGRGLFRRGPKVVSETTDIYAFGCDDSLEDHPSDVEESNPRTALPAVNQGSVVGSRRSTDPAQQMNSRMPSPCEGSLGDQEMDNYPAENEIEGLADDEICSLGTDDDMDNPAVEDEAPIFVTDSFTLIDEEMGGSRIHGFICWLRENCGWVELFYKHGLTHAAMDDILNLIESPCRSWKTVISNITNATPVALEDYAVCPGHMCLTELTGAAEVTKCPICGKEKPAAAMMRPNESVSYLPLVPRIKEMISDVALSEQLYSYRRGLNVDTDCSDGVLRDYFDSSSFATLRNMYGGEEDLEHDIFIAASTDGFQAFKNNSCDVWPLIAILFNLPPHLRFMAKNVLPLMFIPNEVQPKDLQSYLIPFVNELLMTLEDGGVKAQLPNGQEVRFRIHLIWFTADLAGLVKIAGITGHVGRFPCRLCLVEGFYSPIFQHYYYPTWLKAMREGDAHLQFYDPRNLQPRTVEHTLSVLQRLEVARNITERKRIATETGVKQRSVLLALPNMKPFLCFPPDIMHLFYNVQMELLNHHMSGMQDGFALLQSDINVLDNELVGFAAGISGQMAVKPRPLSRYTSWKAAEHKIFTLSYSLILFDGYLSKEYLDGLSFFVKMADLCFRPSVSRSEAREVKRLALRFVEHFEACYVRHEQERVNYCKYVIHLLLHLGDSILEYGPLMSSGQYWVQKYIGWIGSRSNAKVLPAKSMAKSAWFGEAKRLFFKQPFHENESNFQALTDLGGYRFLGPTKDMTLVNMEDDVNIIDLIAVYLARKHEGLHPSAARVVASKVEDLKLWSRLQFLCGSDSQTAYSAKVVDETFRTSRENIRPSCYVSVEMDVTETNADVYYGKVSRLFQLDVRSCDPNNAGSLRCRGKYDLAMIQWVRGMLSGVQGQVFKVGSKESVFGRTTVEDVSVIRRLIGVVEHSVPTGQATSMHNVRRRKQTYFLDDFQRIDHLLSRTRRSEDGVNRRLRGMETGR